MTVTGPAVLVLAKAPVPGRVKTRLSPPLSSVAAAHLAAAALLDSLDAARGVPAGVAVAVLTGVLDRAVERDALHAALRHTAVLPQRGDTLGARIAAAHADAAAALPGRRTLQIGMDTPQVDTALLTESDAVLASRGVDAVLGPATDGGWWALGLRRPADAELVVDVPTSRADTGERTLAALRAAGLRVALLPEVADVDTHADAVAAAAAAPHTRFAAAFRAVTVAAS